MVGRQRQVCIRGRCGVVWSGVVLHCLVWCCVGGLVWSCFFVWSGVVWCGFALSGVVLFGLVWFLFDGLLCFCFVWCGIEGFWCGFVWTDALVRCGMVWSGLLWSCLVWCGFLMVFMWCCVVWNGFVRPGVVLCGLMFCCMVLCGLV